MQLHQLKPSKRKKKKEIGRGGAHQKSATRGMKGQKARSGGGKGRFFEGTKMPLFRRTPKLRGFKSMYEKDNVVNVAVLDKKFENGEIVSPKTLLGKNLIRKADPRVKILGSGELNKKLVITDCVVSKSAKEKIEKAGGEIKQSLV